MCASMCAYLPDVVSCMVLRRYHQRTLAGQIAVGWMDLRPLHFLGLSL